ncbi:MAG: tRNA (N6-isopentenyl adenosine(37)-C2)-methylthiotransferase MiaB [Pseudomonadota bacterium]
MPLRIHIETYGCQMNDYESDRMRRMFLEQHGYEWSDTPEEADVVLFNTCSVREKADQKALSSIGRLRAAKLVNPDMVVAVGGCMAQSMAAEIQARAPYVDLVLGTHQWARLPNLVEKVRAERLRLIEIDFYGWKDYRFLPVYESRIAHSVSEFVTVQNGCNKFCTFCVVPFTRGREVSRPSEEILAEIRALTAAGVKEVVLLGQNVNAYGRDRSGLVSFADLLDEIANIKDLKRLRFMTSHPAEMSEELIERVAGNEKVCEHLHLPLQSGSDRVLEKMNRQHTMGHYRNVMELLRKKIPGIHITTDLIVAFPSETEKDFEATLAAMREFEFSDSYSFCFSPRPHTKAEKWSAEFVPPEVASERLARLQALQRELSARRNQAYTGAAVEVLVEGRAKRGEEHWTGRTRTNLAVNFPGESEDAGRLVSVRIVSAMAHCLAAERLGGPC